MSSRSFSETLKDLVYFNREISREQLQKYQKVYSKEEFDLLNILLTKEYEHFPAIAELERRIMRLNWSKVEDDDLCTVIAKLGIYPEIHYHDGMFLKVIKMLKGCLLQRNNLKVLLGSLPETIKTKRPLRLQEVNLLNMQLVGVLRAASTMNLRDTRLTKAYSEILSEKQFIETLKFDIVCLLDCLWALEKLSVPHGPWTKTVIEAISGMKKDLNMDRLKRLLWITAHFDKSIGKETLAPLVRLMLQNGKIRKDGVFITPTNGHQMCQIALSLCPWYAKMSTGSLTLSHQAVQAEHSDLVEFAASTRLGFNVARWLKSGVDTGMGLKSMAVKFWHGNAEDEGNFMMFYHNRYINQSRFEPRFKKVLLGMPEGAGLRENVIIGIYEVDIVLKDNTIIELLGKRHFISGTKEVTANERIKLNHLRAMGYDKIVLINFEEWGNLDLRPQDREKFIRNQLQQV
jgi:hypothetical protein